MWKQLKIALRLLATMTVLTGILYPGLVTALCQRLFPAQANGSLISAKGRIVGSTLIGQNFSEPQYFHPRPSAAGKHGYNATESGGSNYGPTNPKLIERVKTAIARFRKDNPEYKGPVPSDLVTASGSGLDPDISPASAYAQAPRVAVARNIPLKKLTGLIAHYTKGRELGFLGEPRVNVLELNVALDRQFPLSEDHHR